MWQQKLVKHWYFVLLAAFYISWLIYITMSNNWGLWQDYWAMPATMTLGSFIAGSTPSGGAAVAFPVFTKLLNIPSEHAKIFGLMIQSVGMTSAALYIFYRKINILKPVVVYASLGGFVGSFVAINWIHIPSDMAKILFSSMVFLFACVLWFCYWRRPNTQTQLPYTQHTQMAGIFIFAGFIGGIIAETTGSGVDILVFIVLTLSYRIKEKISIPTTVVCMAINSLWGVVMHNTYVNDTHIMYEPWLISAPIVAIGAPLGAYVLTKLCRTKVTCLVTVLIAIDVISTFALIQLNQQLISALAINLFASSALFYWLVVRTNKFQLGEITR
ncbi:sulfite exporter TauE/SafE family protein [Catenovulum agarivorans]|uniref:sulfite exporter TauE/SafE family protein n=1 Tax=Catenovulum agarivorans TaxID=1172192 RepID=UPI000308DFC3|nr:sulfite exporter TauE/SafE family protein [Catenovulum agarivorans]